MDLSFMASENFALMLAVGSTPVGGVWRWAESY
jgi:hypothetical protein